MGLLSGKIACTRMDIVSAPEAIAFERMAFRALQRGTQLTQSEGFIPFEIDSSIPAFVAAAAVPACYAAEIIASARFIQRFTE